MCEWIRETNAPPCAATGSALNGRHSLFASSTSRLIILILSRVSSVQTPSRLNVKPDPASSCPGSVNAICDSRMASSRWYSESSFWRKWQRLCSSSARKYADSTHLFSHTATLHTLRSFSGLDKASYASVEHTQLGQLHEQRSSWRINHTIYSLITDHLDANDIITISRIWNVELCIPW